MKLEKSLEMEEILGLLTVKAESSADGFSFPPPLAVWSQHGADHQVTPALQAPVTAVFHGVGSGHGHDWEGVPPLASTPGSCWPTALAQARSKHIPAAPWDRPTSSSHDRTTRKCLGFYAFSALFCF